MSSENRWLVFGVALVAVGVMSFNFLLLLAAVAAAWAFGISPELIGAGIETFDLTTAHA